MQASATDLDIELKVYYAGVNRWKHAEIADKVVAFKADYLVMYPVRGHARYLLETMEKAKIKTLFINTDIYSGDKEIFGSPRDKFKYWIGHIFPDDRQAGYDLADFLIRAAEKKKLYNKDRKIELIGISGAHESNAAIFRNEGLNQAVKDHKQNLHQILFAKWKRQKATDATLKLIQRYPDTQVFWAASDSMSLGIIDAIEKMKKTPGQTIITGGVDWMPGALSAVRSGKMTATMGGHFMEGGWAMVFLHDYHNGRDFSESEGVTMNSKMGVIHEGNVEKYYQYFKTGNWDKIDFKQFSKIYNPKIKKYDFSLEAVLQSVDK